MMNGGNMAELVTKTVYFSEPGKANTDRTLALAGERAEALGIQTILVATTTGATGARATELLPGFDIVAVTHSTGFPAPNVQELTSENREAIEAAGAHVLTATHAFGGVGRAVRKKLGTYEVEEIIAFTLRTFGQGMKVVAEIALMAADAGLAPVDEPAMVIAGTGRGADTAVVLIPTHAQTFFDLKFLEVVCMPAPEHPGI
jgi:hypothetical protein